MPNPVRFPKGLTTFPSRSIMGSYPIGTSPAQIALTEDFIPYRPGDYTVTTAVAGTAATFPQLSGAIKLATSASATDTEYLMRLGAAYQFMPLNQLWFDMKVAYPRTVLNANDTNIFLGLFNNAVPTAATDGVYFQKPAGGTAVNLVIKKAGVTTTFSNVADMALPSGLFGDTNSVNGVLSSTIAGGAFTGVTVSTPGAGYQTSPLVLSTATAAGAVGSTPVIVAIGSTALSATNPQVPILSTALPYGSLYAPYVVTPGSGFTNAGPLTTLLEVEPLLDFQFYYNGKDTLYAGVNGRQILSIGPGGVVGFAAGATINLATSIAPSFAPTTQLTAAVSPILPGLGSAYNILPQTLLNLVFGFANSTANIRTFYVDEYNVAVELN